MGGIPTCRDEGKMDTEKESPAGESENEEQILEVSQEDVHRLLQLMACWDRMGFTALLRLYQRPVKVGLYNVLFGMLRGIGFVIGVSVVGVALLWVVIEALSHFVDMPIIGKFVAEVIRYAEEYRGAPK